MFCPYCGKENVNDAAFCSHCGKSISTAVSPKVDVSSWEYCQIQAWWKDVSRESCVTTMMGAYGLRYECYFWADAVGNNGPYSAATSPKFRIDGRLWVWEEPPNPPMGRKSEDTALSRKILNDLINSLIEDGWEAIPERGPSVWSNKFKRKDIIPTARIFSETLPYNGNRFDGEWIMSGSPDVKFSFEIKGNSGICKISNSPHKKIGQVIFQIEKAVDDAFIAKQMFADGSWVNVTGALREKELWLFGKESKWKLDKLIILKDI